MAGSTDLSLRLSFWFLNHKDQLKKWWVLVIVAVVVILLSGWLVVSLVVRADQQALQRAFATRTQSVIAVSDALQAGVQPLTVGTARALAMTDKRVTLVAELANPNDYYQAEVVRYKFRHGNQESPVRTATILPNTRRFVFESNITGAAATATPSIEIVSVDWRRPTDPTLFSRLRFDVKDITLDTSATTVGQSPSPAPRLKATVTNNSVFSFRVVDLSIALVDNNQVVAVEQLSQRDWLATTSRQVDIQWLQSVPTSAQAVIVPQLNLLDTENRIRQ